ncbi:MAG: ribosomal-protein-alanine N-acetyltransferase RimI, partial [Planctomycetia bacterium]
MNTGYTPTRQELRVHIRWMIRRDMPEVLHIEQESYDFAWTEEDFLQCLRQR